MRAVYLIGSLDIGGIETFLLRFLRYLTETNCSWENTVLCKSGQVGPMREAYRQLGVEVITQKIGYLDIRGCFALRKFFRQRAIDAVCDFTGDFAGIPLWLAQGTGIEKRMAWYRGSTHRFRSTPLRLLYAKCSRHLVKRHATDILSNSIAARQFFFGDSWKRDQRFAVIRNGIPLKEFGKCASLDELRRELGIPPATQVIGYIARYAPYKNHRTVLSVAEKIQEKRDDIVFLLVGDGVCAGVEPQVRARALSNVICSPARQDIPSVLQLLDVLYFPSLTEGQPNVLLEAMITGIPFVASDIDAIRECVQPDGHRWLVEPRDVDGAVTKLLAILDDPKHAAWFQKENREWARTTYSAARCFGAFQRCLLGDTSHESQNSS